MSRWMRAIGGRIAAALVILGGGLGAIGCDDDGAWGPSELRVASITLGSPTAPPPRVEPGETYQLVVEAFDKDGNTVSLADVKLEWSSSDAAIATVSRTGKVTGVAEGVATIKVTLRDKEATRVILVQYVGASVTIVPGAGVLEPGQTIQLTATVRDDEGNVLNHPVTWASDNGTVATVSTSGLVTAVAVGSAAITATSEGLIGAAQVTVQEPVAVVEVAPAVAAVAPGATLQLVATPRDQFGIALVRPITWSSSDAAVAAVDANGLVTGGALGPAVITAASGGKQGFAEITVQVPVASVTVTSPLSGGEPLETGLTLQLTAVAQDAQGNVLDRPVTWSSSNPAFATVDATGLVTGISRGTVTVTATSEGKSGTISVKVVGEGETTGGNNLSVPLVFAEGIGITGLPVATETGLRPTATEGIVVDVLPFFYSGNVPDCGTIYYCQNTTNVWQAEWLDGTLSGMQQAEVAFGDNLTHHAFSTTSSIRVEVALNAFAVSPMVGFAMPYSFGTGEAEIKGTDGVPLAQVPVIYAVTPRLIIERIDDVTRQPIATIFDGAVWEGLGGDGPGAFGAEVNVGGGVVFGYNLQLSSVTLPGGIPKAGWYRITFRLDDNATVGGAVVARNLALVQLATGDEPPTYAPQIDPATNTAWLDIEVQ